MVNLSERMRQSPVAQQLYANALPEQIRVRAKDFFQYAVEFLPLAAAGTASQDIAIQNDSDFLIVACNAIVTDAANVVFTAVNQAPFLATIVDAGSGRQLQNRAVHFSTLYGDATLPGYLNFPKMMDRASTLRTTLQNLDAANAYNVRVTYAGFKVFDTTMGRQAGA